MTIEHGPPEDIEAIRRLHERDREAMETGALELLPKLATEEVVMMPPGGDCVRGREAMRAGLEGWRAAYERYADVSSRYEVEEIHVNGDEAWEWGVLASRVVRTDGGIEVERHRMLRLLRREPDGAWRIHRSIWNEIPAQEPVSGSAVGAPDAPGAAPDDAGG